jgi:hypothetical protein
VVVLDLFVVEAVVRAAILLYRHTLSLEDPQFQSLWVLGAPLGMTMPEQEFTRLVVRIHLLVAHISLSVAVAVEATEAGHKMGTMAVLEEEVQTSRVQRIPDMEEQELPDKDLMEGIRDAEEAEKYLVVVAAAPVALVPMGLPPIVEVVHTDHILQEMAGMEFKTLLQEPQFGMLEAVAEVDSVPIQLQATVPQGHKIFMAPTDWVADKLPMAEVDNVKLLQVLLLQKAGDRELSWLNMQVHR